MHDPLTVAFEIKRPWPVPKQKGSLGPAGWRYYPSIVTIWHKDPETDGTDDSCGWGRVKLTKDQKGKLHFMASCEAREPWLLKDRAKRPLSVASTELKLRGALVDVARLLKVKFSLEEATELASSLLHNQTDNIRSLLCHLPGYHTNYQDDREDQRERCAEHLYTILAQCILRRKRHWWQHPRWHFWHWQFQVHFLQTFKRWAWGKCCKCGKGFSWGYCPVSDSWHGDGGPKWFRSEKSIYHADCSNPTHDGASQAVAGEKNG